MPSVDPGQYAGPLLDSHQLIDSVYIANTSDEPITLTAARPTTGYNVKVKQAFVVPATSSSEPSTGSIVGVLRWPRPTDENNPSFDVLQERRPLRGFVLPAYSREQWLVTLLLEQKNPVQSMRTGGTTITYTAGDRQYEQQIATALCFFTDLDKQACPDAAADFD